jgi:uroporphyrinogen-III synthase
MAVLVTRPSPDDETTAKALRARGFDVLRAPMLRFEPVPFQDDADANYGAVIVTSANALRAIAPHLAGSRLLKLSLFAVGENTAAAARDAGFGDVIASKGDAGALRDLVLARAKSKQLKKASPILYLAGADLARDLASELGENGFTVVTQTTYRMVPAPSLPREICDAFVAHELRPCCITPGAARGHFWRRHAQAASKSRHWRCRNAAFRPAVAAVLRDAGATQVTAAASPDETALFEALGRALQPRPSP